MISISRSGCPLGKPETYGDRNRASANVPETRNRNEANLIKCETNAEIFRRRANQPLFLPETAVIRNPLGQAFVWDLASLGPRAAFAGERLLLKLSA